MKTNRKAAILALGLALLPPLAGARLVDTEWWKVDFASPTPLGLNEEGGQCGGVTLPDGASVAVLTNRVDHGPDSRPAYASGFWYMEPDDDSVITNSVVTNALAGTSETSLHIKLDTQGNDLMWAPSNSIVKDIINVVDADLLLVGSDSAPEPTEFDTNATKRVQAAIYLKNELDENQETINSVLCVYARNVDTGKNEWRELAGDVEIEDNSWHHVHVSIDYTGDDSPIILVEVDGKRMTPRSGRTEIVTANPTEANTAGKVQEVCFRGTGAVDNFVGKTQVKVETKLWFETKIYRDGNELTEEDFADLYWDWVAYNEAKVGDVGDDPTVAEFTDIWATDTDISFGPEQSDEPSWCLDKVVLHRFGTPGGTDTYVYHWNENTFQIDSDPGNGETTEIVFSDDGYGSQDGFLSLHPITNGATDPTNLIAEVYLKTIGAFNANAVTEVGGTVETNSTILKPVAAGGTYPTNLVWTFDATDGANILTGIRVENGAAATYAPGANAGDGVATVEVSLDGPLAADTTFVTATYAEGSYTAAPTWIDNGDGTYTLGNYVAKIDGEPVQYFGTLQDAIDACQAGQTIAMIADVRTTSETTITNTVVLDLNGFTITAGNTSARRFRIYSNGDLTLTNSVPETGGIVSDEFLPSNTGCVLIRVDGAFTMNGGRVEALLTAIDADTGRLEGANAIAPFGTGTITVNGGTIEAAGYALSLNGIESGPNYSNGAKITINDGALVSTNNAAVFVPAGDVTINGGAITGLTGVYCKGGHLAVPADSTAVITAVGAAADWEQRSDGSSSTGNALVLDNSNYVYGPVLADIRGGTFVSEHGIAIGNYAAAGQPTATGFVYGGSFSDVVPADCCAEGFVPVTTSDPVTGLYTVKRGAIQATVGGDTFTYGTFADAIASNGWTTVYTLLTNVEETVTITNANDTFSVVLGAFADGLVVTSAVPATAEFTYAVTNATEDGVTTYAVQATKRSYDVVWHVEGAESTNQVAYGEVPEYTGEPPTKASDDASAYAFDGWAATMGGEKLETLPAVNGPTNYYAVFAATPRVYTISWFMDDGTAIDTTEVAYGDPPTHANPTKPDAVGTAYTFDGWAGTQGGAKIDPLPDVTGEAAYYAVFTSAPREYDIAYDLVGNLDGVPDVPVPAWPAGYDATNKFTVAFPDIVLPDPVCDGWAFQGWITNGYAAVLQNPGTVPAGSTTNYAFEAVWAQKLTAQFLSDGVLYTNLTVVSGEDFAAPEPPAKADAAGWSFDFANWVDATGAVVAFPTNIVEDQTTFTATFTSSAIPYTVVYDLDGGTDPGNPAEYRVTDGTVNLAVATKDYYAFGGWTNRNGDAATAIAIADADENDEISYGATWTPVEFTITYVLEAGATNAAANPASYTVETPTFSLQPAGKEGFEFKGWVDGNNATNLAPEVTLGSHGPLTFTAVFESAAVDPVDPGEAMTPEEKAETPPVGVVTDPVTEEPVFEVRFRGVAGITYELLAAGSLDVTENQWTHPDNVNVKVVATVVVTDANAGEIQTLKFDIGPDAPDVQFFKIGARRTGN